MRPSPWKRRLVTTVRWSLLVDALVSLPWAGHAFDLVHFDTPCAQIERYAIVRFLASVTR